jgi:hypothetical protein
MTFLCFWQVSEVSEHRVSDPGILKSIGVSVSNTGAEVSEDRVSDSEKSIGCPALESFDCNVLVIATFFSESMGQIYKKSGLQVNTGTV